MDEYWAGNEDLYEMVLHAALTGESLDQLIESRSSSSRILFAKSNGKCDDFPRKIQSIVTPKRSVSSAAAVSLMGRFPPSHLDQ